MTQISRPFQIALAAVAVLGVVWVLALHGHSSNSAQPASQSSGGGNSAASPSKIYHGSAPGVEGLTRAVDKAHGAVATSQQNAKELEEKSAAASSANAPSTSSSSSSASVTRATGGTQAKVTTHTKTTTHTTTSGHVTETSTQVKTSTHASHKPAPSAAGRVVGVSARQQAVESELAHGRVVVILFWNKKAADDRAVHAELHVLLGAHGEAGARRAKSTISKEAKRYGLELSKPIAVHYATEKEVATFGTFTRNVQVFGTPTLLIVGKTGKTITLTGLQDAFSIEQTIDEVRHAQS